MSFDKIQLPDFLIADLYKSSLVEILPFPQKKEPIKEEELAQKPTQAQVSNQIEYLGENRKHVAIVVNDAATIHLTESDKAFLTNVLKACQLNLVDIAIVNAAKQEVTYDKLKEQLNPQQILLFNVEPTAIKLPFSIPAFQIQKFDNCTIMLAPALSVVNQATADGKLLKTKLWMSLKQMFGI